MRCGQDVVHYSLILGHLDKCGDLFFGCCEFQVLFRVVITSSTGAFAGPVVAKVATRSKFKRSISHKRN